MSGEHVFPTATSDGTGGAIIVWGGPGVDQFPDLYAQRIDSSGRLLWGSNGVLLVSAPNAQATAGVIPDGHNGAIIAWEDGRDSGFDVYVQRLSAEGQSLWASNGVRLTAGTGGLANFISIVSDQDGGAILAWNDSRNYFGDIYAQRVNSSGIALWTSNGVALTSLFADQSFPLLATDGAGGAIVAWVDQRSGEPDIYAGRVDSNGAVLWGVDGVPVCTAPNLQMFPRIVSDNAGGAIVTWDDFRNAAASRGDIYCQRLNAAGNSLWASNGVPVCSQADHQYGGGLVTDGEHGAIIGWVDQRSGNNDLYAQRMDAAGFARWASNGIPVSTAPGDLMNPHLVSDGSRGAIFAWEDSRSGAGSDIYANRFSPPVANPGGPYQGQAGIPVSFNGLGSVDPGGDPLTFSWDFGDGNTGSGPQVMHDFATNGVYQVVLTVSDGVFSDAAATTVNLSAINPVDCSHAVAFPAQLWPPDHRLVPVDIIGVKGSRQDAVSITVRKVTQSDGDQTTDSADAIITPNGASVRAERSGNGGGRLYTIWFTATDGHGSSCDGSVQVCVLHDQNHTTCFQQR
jgi:PKD repeat protein